MSAPYTNLRDVMLDLVQRCRNYDVFTGIITVAEDHGDNLADVAQVQAVLGGNGSSSSYIPGMGIVWRTPTAVDALPNVRFGPMQIILPVRVLCDPEIYTQAGGTLHATTVARHLRDLCKHYAPGGLTKTLTLRPPGIQAVEDWVPVAYEMAFETMESDTMIVTQVAAPVISASSASHPSTITLTCATAGAAIYYTTDGSNPGPNNGTLYSTPFTQSAAARIRAGAYKSGSIPSNVTFADIL